MKVTVNRSLCEHHAQCVTEAPHVFSINSSGRLEYSPDVSEDEADAVEEAAEMCPVMAIMIQD